MFERTMIDVDGRVARVVTRPHKGGSAYEYRLHRHGDAWVLSRERDWYTRHALRYAERELETEVVRRQLTAEQSTLGDDFDDDRPSEHLGGMQARAAD